MGAFANFGSGRIVFGVGDNRVVVGLAACEKEGAHKPYPCKGKAYRRSDSSTVEVDKLEYGRLVLEGSNLYYDQLGSSSQQLSFALLKENAMAGTDVVRFGKSINDMLDRVTVEGASALRQYESALEMYERYYAFDRIEGSLRRRHELVPYEAFGGLFP